MKTYEFFNANLGRHLVDQSGDPWDAATPATTALGRLAVIQGPAEGHLPTAATCHEQPYDFSSV